MPVIKVWCLPADQSEEQLSILHQRIVTAVVGIPELELKDENDMTCLFPPDSMKYGLGSEIIVEIEVFEKPKRTTKVLQKLAKDVGSAVKELYSAAKVECSIYRFKPEEGFWSSNTNQKRVTTGEKVLKILTNIFFSTIVGICTLLTVFLFLTLLMHLNLSQEPVTWQLVIDFLLKDSLNFYISFIIGVLLLIGRYIGRYIGNYP